LTPFETGRAEESRSTQVWPPPARAQALAKLFTRRWLPGRLAEECLAVAALIQGVASRRRWRRALAWAAGQPHRGRPAWALAAALLAFRGRQFATRHQLGVRDLAALRDRVTIEGAERLDVATRAGGVLLLGFHLGPLVDPVALRAHGFAVTLGLRRRPAASPTAWWQHPAEDLVLFPNPAWRVRGLYELRQRLHSGRTVYLAGDGIHGSEAFRIALPVVPLILRTGWLILRRTTRATTLPVLSHREGRRVVVTLHEPLPVPVESEAADVAACRAHLTPLLEDYVRRFPEQCFSLALQPTPPDFDDASGN
jgi:lauroyl/myristoyl acyltransferase